MPEEVLRFKPVNAFTTSNSSTQSYVLAEILRQAEQADRAKDFRTSIDLWDRYWQVKNWDGKSTIWWGGRRLERDRVVIEAPEQDSTERSRIEAYLARVKARTGWNSGVVLTPSYSEGITLDAPDAPKEETWDNRGSRRLKS